MEALQLVLKSGLHLQIKVFPPKVIEAIVKPQSGFLCTLLVLLIGLHLWIKLNQGVE